MDIKGIVTDQLKEQAKSNLPVIQSKLNEIVIGKIQSKDFEEKWATVVNKKINLPGISEKAEQVIFEKMIDKGTDLVAGVMQEILEEAVEEVLEQL
jgi:hypothetical protein|tara:strand:+ start:170 stop:457 length:288 start_codon:yes stop_codon:yes gene_type:complete